MEGANATKAILSWTIGISAIAFVLLLIVIIFGNLSGNVGFEDGSQGMTITNETGAFVNTTGYTVSGYNSTWSSINATAVWANVSLTPYLIPSTNYSLSTVGVLTNATIVPNATEYNDANISYTYAFPYTTQAQQDTEQIIGNYTKSAVNTAAQFPTVGTILGVALLILILLALLVYVIVKMSGVSIGGKSKGDFKEGNFG